MTTNSSGTTASANAAAGGGSKRLAQQQAQVDEVVNIMRENVDKVLERDKNLSLLDDRADKLQHNAAQFEQHAGKLKRKYWWKNMKMMIIMGIVGTIFAIVVIAWIASKVKAVAPVLPSTDESTSIPAVIEEVSPASGGAMEIPSVVKLTTKTKNSNRRRTKTSTAVSNILSSSISSIEAPIIVDENNAPAPVSTSDDDDAAKKAIKRVIRAILNRS